MSGCDLCVEARASSARGVVVECACGEVYERGRWVDPSPQASAGASPSGPVWPERGTAELVYHADPDAPMERRPPSALVPVASLDPDAKLRALLSELRPDRDGPYGWAPDGVEPLPPDIIRGADGKLREAVGPLVRVAMRVDGTAEVPAILPGAFASTGGVINPSRPPTLAGPLPMWSAGELVRERIEAMAWCDAKWTLLWLQDHGTLARGRAALYDALAEARAGAKLKARWAKYDLGTRRTGKRGWASQRVEEAMAAWWSDRALTRAV